MNKLGINYFFNFNLTSCLKDIFQLFSKQLLFQLIQAESICKKVSLTQKSVPNGKSVPSPKSVTNAKPVKGAKCVPNAKSVPNAKEVFT